MKSVAFDLPPLGMGCAPLGELFTRVSEDTAQATLNAAWESGIRYFDTAPFYGHGKSEHRVGQFLRDQNREEFVLTTKVGRCYSAAGASYDPSPWRGGLPFQFRFDYSYDGIMRSWKDSLQRLSLNRIDALIIHDLGPDFHDAESLEKHWRDLRRSGWKALEELRRGGQVKALGAGINLPGLMPRFLQELDLDLFLVAMPYTLLDQGAGVVEEELVLCQQRGVRVIIGAVFASGLLIDGAVEGARYAYEPAPEKKIRQTAAIQKICESHGVPLPAAAIQFPLAHPVVSSVIPGAMEPAHIEQIQANYRHRIPAAFWAELRAAGLLHPQAPSPDQ